ncbi:outer membrane lipid asymmetry maintenance protein MlaD [Phenylobacterium montanum]|uniref:Outer membrane lipid asymmetry maintenance protein MlaD n=1 Tax=Phenylobacterium montanum TaxID=2823693 RepID=A0A975FZR0_9CAUL|nr:outer membrane lipid asymmetry maintenance protein MlaD [Caulobacter sp. S6]QUD88129.1 outer membrane lipid asymmetry maintenance protein MlaD [Caulobacter sp. S6]
MRGQWVETGLGAVVLAAAASFLIYALSAGAIHTKAHGYDLTARFGQVGALAPGADVRVAGVKVGTVSAVTLDSKTFMAITRMTMDPTVKLPADSTAKVTSDGLLGGSHIAIEPGGAQGDMKPGDEFQNTQGAVDLFGLIGQFIRPQSPAASSAPAAAAPAASPAPAADPYGVPASNGGH